MHTCTLCSVLAGLILICTTSNVNSGIFVRNVSKLAFAYLFY